MMLTVGSVFIIPENREKGFIHASLWVAEHH